MRIALYIFLALLLVFLVGILLYYNHNKQNAMEMEYVIKAENVEKKELLNELSLTKEHRDQLDNENYLRQGYQFLLEAIIAKKQAEEIEYLRQRLGHELKTRGPLTDCRYPPKGILGKVHPRMYSWDVIDSSSPTVEICWRKTWGQTGELYAR